MQPSARQSPAPPLTVPLRRATDEVPRPAPRPARRISYRSILALLDTFNMPADMPLPNPASGRDALLQALAPLLTQTASVSLLLVHVAPPFALREACGLGVADAFQRGLLTRLRASLRRTDLVHRLTDHDFALVLRQCGADQAAAVAARMSDALNRTCIATEAGDLALSVAIGTATAGGVTAEGAALLQAAEDALDRARCGDPSTSQAPVPTVRAVARAIIEAHDESRLVLALQPIVLARTRQIFCFEALTRLRRDDGSVLSPADIMPVAEQTGLITRIDGRALELAVARLAAHPAQHLSVNVSMRSALDPAWLALATDLLAHDRPVAERLIVEITESAAVDDLAATCALLAQLKRFGVRIAMDDFGAGHSSFRNLRQLGVDLLKIDGAFVRDLGRSEDDGVFIRALIDLARHLGIATVAEYVEDEATAATLTDWGVDYLQGHLIGRAEIG